MFSFCRNFCVKRDFISNPMTLKRRLKVVGLAMLLLSPFIAIFMLVFLFLRHAEQFYHHPSIALSRRWSTLSKWLFRQYNEVIIILLLFYQDHPKFYLCLKCGYDSVCLLSLSVYYIFYWQQLFYVNDIRILSFNQRKECYNDGNE